MNRNRLLKNNNSGKDKPLHTANFLLQNTFLLLLNVYDKTGDPYIFEFQGLKQQQVLPEKELELAFPDHRQHWRRPFFSGRLTLGAMERYGTSE